MEQWKEYKLGEILNFRRGYDLPKDKMSGGKYPVAGSTGIIGYHNVATPISPCITIGRSGSIGHPRYYDKCWAHNTTLYIDDYKGNDPKFLYYFLMTIPLCEMGAGSAVPTLNRNHIHPLKVVFPTNVELQRRIAAILSSLDDKIEVNRRINDNLEQQAQALFRSWFVDFEPFGGTMPKDWRVQPFATLIEDIISGDWGQDSPLGNYTERVSCVRGADIPEVIKGDLGNMPIRYILRKNFMTKALKGNHLVVEISGGTATQATGRICPLNDQFVNRFGGNIICSNFCKSITPANCYKWYVYYLWKYLYKQGVMFMYENGSSGIKNFNIKEFLNRTDVIMPPKETLKEFNNLINIIHLQIQSYGIENSSLASLRDTLLPKLMSGEVSVK